MRIGSIVLLTFSFILGAAAAVAVRLSIDAKQIETVNLKGPTVKILITNEDIAGGAEITADSVFFEEVPVAEVPAEALTSFKEVYKRRTAFPIPAGYPVCRDFLLNENTAQTKSSAFLPPGSRIVSLEVEQLRNGASVSELSEPITNYLTPGQHIVIRAVPAEEPQGIYAERKNQLLKAFIPQSGVNEGEIVLDNVEVLRVLAKNEDVARMRQLQSLTLLLSQSETEKLLNASKKFRLRVAVSPQQAYNSDNTAQTQEIKVEEREIKSEETQTDVFAAASQAVIADEKTKAEAKPVVDEAKHEAQTQTAAAAPAAPAVSPAIAEEVAVVSPANDTELSSAPEETKDDECVKDDATLAAPRPPALVVDFTASEEEQLTVPLKIERQPSNLVFKKPEEPVLDSKPVEAAQTETAAPPTSSRPSLSVPKYPNPVITVGGLGTEKTGKNAAGYSPFGIQSRLPLE